MNFLKLLFGGFASAAPAAANLRRAWSGDRVEQDRQAADKYQAAAAQYASEFTRADRGFLDRLVDFLNRLVRPIAAFSVLSFFYFAFFDPLAFAARAPGLSLIPFEMWTIAGLVLTFYFGGRHLEIKARLRAPSPAEVGAVVNQIQAIQAIAKPDRHRAAADLNPALDDFKRIEK